MDLMLDPSENLPAADRQAAGEERLSGPQVRTAQPEQRGRADAARWIICFALVAACHGGAAWALFRDLADDPGYGVDAPAVMLDLPESLIPETAPPQELAPGPVETEESEAQPAPKEETKPPEPEAEVALPLPDPPKPEPPSEEKHATAPPAARTPPPSVARWESQLVAHLEHFKRYPAAARAHAQTGIATVSFTMNHEGRLVRSSIVKSSGSPALDQETLAMLVRAQPLPRPPEQVSDAELTFVVPVRFNIR